MWLNTYKADTVELGYFDLLNGLMEDLVSDETIPTNERKEALQLTNKLCNILEKYSA